LIDIIATAS